MSEPVESSGTDAGIASRSSHFIRNNLNAILIVIVPALLITALSPAGEGLRELIFPTRVDVTGSVKLPEGHFPSLSLLLDGETEVLADDTRSFVVEGGQRAHTH